MKIATLITCFNRKDSTIRCVRDVLQQRVDTDIFIVDGGSRDGTPEVLASEYPQVECKVVNGLFWAGGMREAWNMAVEKGGYDAYALINDDTHLYGHAYETLLSVASGRGMECVVVGSTSDPDTGHFTYGGRRLIRPGRSKNRPVMPSDTEPLDCELGNANIMLVPHKVYTMIRGLSGEYTHGIADYDYTMRACTAGIPVLVAPGWLGTCRNDHPNAWLGQNTTLKDRKKYLHSPKGLAYEEYMVFIHRYFSAEEPSLKFKLHLKTYLPVLWQIFKGKGQKKKR